MLDPGTCATAVNDTQTDGNPFRTWILNLEYSGSPDLPLSSVDILDYLTFHIAMELAVRDLASKIRELVIKST